MRTLVGSGFLLVITAGLTISSASAGDWPRFRGPNGDGISPDTVAPPLKFSATENLKWSVELPGEGVSSPIIVGDRVFITAYSGYGFEPGDLLDLKRHLLCLDRKSGKILWQKSIEAVLPEDSFSGLGVPAHGYASHTPVSDGKRVYAFFGKSGVYAYDLDGKQLWRASVGTESDRRRWGSSSSPILVENTLVVTAGPERRAMVGLDAETGKELWAAESESFGDVWGTPILVTSGDRTDIVIGAPGEMWGINPKTGKVRWYCEAIQSDQFNTSVVASDGVIFAVEGRGGGAIAIKAGGKGDVSQSNVLWTGRDANRFGTPVVYEGRIYFVANGIANCLDAKTGSKLYQSRLPRPDGADNEPQQDSGRGRGGFGGQDYASPVIAAGRVYYVSAGGDIHVWKTGDSFESLAVNRLASGETFAATPAISAGDLFFRSNKKLYCVGAK